MPRRAYLLLALLVGLLPSPAAAQETIFGGMTWMTFFPSTWNAGAPKIVSDGLFYYAIFCGPGGSFTCTMARKRGDANEPWTMSTHSWFSSQPPTMIIDRKGRLNFFYNDYQLKHIRIDQPQVNFDQWTEIPTDFVPQVAYLTASYNAISDEILVTFNETSIWTVYIGRKVGDGPWTYTVVEERPTGKVDTYFRTVAVPGKYAILASEFVKGGPNYIYDAAVLFEATSASGPWTRREIHRVTGDNVGIPYENWVLANDLQMDSAGHLRALLHITESQSGHANSLDGLYLLREEDNYVPRFITGTLQDGWTLYVDPAGAHIAFLNDVVDTPPALFHLGWFRSDDSGVTWQRQPNGIFDSINPVLVDMRSGSMIGPYLHVMTSDWTTATAAFDHVSFNTIDLSVPNTADRYAYEYVDGDGTTDYTRGFRDAATGREYSYVYDRHPDGSYQWRYSYSAGAYSQTYTAGSDGSYRYANSEGADVSEPPVTIATVTPNLVPLGTGAALVVEGTNFKPGAVIRVNGAIRLTTRVSSVRLTTHLLTSDAAAIGDTKSITVVNPDGGVSSALGVTIASSPATLVPASGTASAGGMATFTVTGGPANQLDWVGWYCPAANGDRAYSDWKYFTNSRNAPSSGLSGGTFTFTAPPVGGSTCVARLFADNGYLRLVASATVNIIDPVVSGPNSALPGPVSIVINDGPGNPTDWVGWYCPQTDADTAYIDWKYLNNSRTALTTGVTSGTVTFQMPGGGGGTCEARLFANNGFTRLAAGNPVTQASPAGALRLTMGPTAVAPRATMSVTAVAGDVPTSNRDGVGLFCPSTSGDQAYVDWKYMNDSKTPPVSSWTVATVTFTAPAALDTKCAARLFSNNGFSLMMASWPITVRSSITLTLASNTVSVGGTISVTAANGPANPLDWVGLYCPPTNGDLSYVDWKYLNGSRTAPATGVTAATVTFTAPGSQGSCDLRFFADNSFTRLASSATVIVQ